MAPILRRLAGQNNIYGDLVPAYDNMYRVGLTARRWMQGFFRGLFVGDGTNESVFETDGTLRFDGDAIVWEDIRVPISAVRLGPAGNPNPELLYGGLVLGFEYQANVVNEERVYFVAQIPHSYKEGTNITPHVHWAPETDDDATARWALTYTWTNIGDTVGAPATIYVNQAINGNADDHLLTEFAQLDGTGKSISSILVCTLTRNSSDAADTFDDDAYLMEFDFHYQMDTVGSRQELLK